MGEGEATVALTDQDVTKTRTMRVPVGTEAASAAE